MTALHEQEIKLTPDFAGRYPNCWGTSLFTTDTLPSLHNVQAKEFAAWLASPLYKTISEWNEVLRDFICTENGRSVEWEFQRVEEDTKSSARSNRAYRIFVNEYRHNQFQGYALINPYQNTIAVRSDSGHLLYTGSTFPHYAVIELKSRQPIERTVILNRCRSIP